MEENLSAYNKATEDLVRTNGTLREKEEQTKAMEKEMERVRKELEETKAINAPLMKKVEAYAELQMKYYTDTAALNKKLVEAKGKVRESVANVRCVEIIPGVRNAGW